MQSTLTNDWWTQLYDAIDMGCEARPPGARLAVRGRLEGHPLAGAPVTSCPFDAADPEPSTDCMVPLTCPGELVQVNLGARDIVGHLYELSVGTMKCVFTRATHA